MKRKYIFKKIIIAIIMIFLIMTINFLIVRFMPGDPLVHIIGEEEYHRLSLYNPEVIEEISREYGFEDSLFTQYKTYLTKMMKLDFGKSYKTQKSVIETIAFRMKWTLLLALPSTIIAAFLGGILGIKAAWNKGGRMDSILSSLMLIISTIPTNAIAIIFLIIFAFRLKLFPIGGMTSGGLTGLEKTMDIIKHMVLPVSILTIRKLSSNFLLMKNTTISVLSEEYINVAKSKGLDDKEILKRHVLKNVLSPYITSICMQFGNIFTGSMLIEIVYSWKGMGSLIYQSVNTKDYPTLQASFLLIGICIIFFNFLADMICLYLDPRVKVGGINE